MTPNEAANAALSALQAATGVGGLAWSAFDKVGRAVPASGRGLPYPDIPF